MVFIIWILLVLIFINPLRRVFSFYLNRKNYQTLLHFPCMLACLRHSSFCRCLFLIQIKLFSIKFLWNFFLYLVVCFLYAKVLYSLKFVSYAWRFFVTKRLSWRPRALLVYDCVYLRKDRAFYTQPHFGGWSPTSALLHWRQVLQMGSSYPHNIFVSSFI